MAEGGIYVCPICKDDFTNPKCLSCIHTFCLNCLEQNQMHSDNAQPSLIVCPTCRQTTAIPTGGLKDLKTNFYVIDMADNCRLHTHERIEMFCKQCDDLICLVCQATTHKDHKCVAVEQEYDEKKKEVERLIITSEMNVITSNRNIASCEETASIHEAVVSMKVNKLENEKETLIQNFTKNFDQGKNTLEEKIENFKSLTNSTVNTQKQKVQTHLKTINDTIESVNKQGDVSFLRKCKSLINDLRSLQVLNCSPAATEDITKTYNQFEEWLTKVKSSNDTLKSTDAQTELRCEEDRS